MGRKLRVYMAGAWVDAKRLAGPRQQLRELGFEVTSEWLDLALNGKPYEGGHEKEARRDYANIDKADFLIIDTLSTGTRGGREWEGGYATGRGKRVMRVGPSIIPFHSVLHKVFPDWESCLTYLATALEHADVREN